MATRSDGSVLSSDVGLLTGNGFNWPGSGKGSETVTISNGLGGSGSTRAGL